MRLYYVSMAVASGLLNGWSCPVSRYYAAMAVYHCMV